MGKLALLALLLAASARAEPAPWGLVVKGEECSAYWGGDECNYYRAPDGWMQLYGEKIKYLDKTCDFKVGKEEKCCQQLGLKFVKLKHEKNLTVQLPAMCAKKGKQK